VHSDMKQNKSNKPGGQEPVPTGWSAASFRISTVDGWLEVDGIVRSPFGIDQRVVDEAGSMSWCVTHLPSGLAVVSQVRERAVALALVDRIAALTDWTARDVVTTAALREQVRQALNQAHDAYLVDRLSTCPDMRHSSPEGATAPASSVQRGIR
jgi:hypothetical protein